MTDIEVDILRQRGEEYELSFHKEVLKDRIGKLLQPRLLTPRLANYLPPHRKEYRILDVGCGPISTLGTKLPNGKPLEILGIDPLSDSYGELLQELGIERPHKAVAAEAEQLSSVFEKDSFDLVFSNNAVDHMRSPFLGIKEMVSICKNNCKIIFNINCNEGLNTIYMGFHQWNFTKIEDTLLFWSPSQAFTLDACIGGLPYNIIETKPKSCANKKYPIVYTCIIHKINFEFINTLSLMDGLHIHYDHKYRTISFVRSEDFVKNDRFFIHMLQRRKVIDRRSFVWDLLTPLKSFVLPDISYDTLRVGQYEPGRGKEKQSERFWQKEIRVM